MQALSLYTRGSAWFSHDEHQRGELKPGYLADLAVLDQNYLNMPESKIHQLRSLLTMVGGKLVHTAAPYTSMPRATARP
jgi:hypothetical protein